MAHVLRWAAIAAVLYPAFGFGDDKQKDFLFFEQHVRPILANHCLMCHGEDEQEGELRLDSLAGMMTGGDSGQVIVPGKPEQSLLIAAVSYKDELLQMPPEKQLTKRQIANLTEWIRRGAFHPDGDPAAWKPATKFDLATARRHWAFRPPAKPPIPAVHNADWPQTPIDFFVLAKLEEHGLTPAAAADKLTLLRRVTFDLTGLPPTPGEVMTFLHDDSPNAFAKTVDRLLDSPAYGERWGRFWLDVARYADSNGLDENIAHGNAWRYRDYVIDAFNKDKPYDTFVTEQIAGDLMPANGDESVKLERLIATGFLSLGPKVLAEVDQVKMEMDIIDEQLTTMSHAFLALTLECSRCHDHKFDPLTQADYYGLAGIFKSTKVMEHYKKIARWWENSLATEADLQRKEAHEKRLAAKKAEIAEFVKLANAEVSKLLGEGASKPQSDKDFEAMYSAEQKAELQQLRESLATIESQTPVMPTAMGVGEREVCDLPIHIRGNHLTLGEIVPRKLPAVLTAGTQPAFPDDQSGRLEFANWLVQPDNPLTSRVIVNRIWLWHFGRAIVPTPDNFGRLGEPPMNLPLLDWLATRLIESDWSLKSLHRDMVLSAAYQMSSQFDPAAAAIDPENRFGWRANVRRLEAEAIRDSILQASGLIDRELGGSLLHVGNREFFFNHTSEDKTKYDSRRRSVYLPVVRNHLYDVFQLFDYADASVSKSRRNSTTVAPQALFLMNSDFVIDAAENLANQLTQAESQTDEERLRTLYLVCFGRMPTEVETRRALRFLADCPPPTSQTDPHQMTRQQAWQTLCHVFFDSNEFLYIK